MDVQGFEGENPKKKKSQNFGEEDKTILIHLVNKYKWIIESKITNAQTNKQKMNVWNNIAIEFNSRSSCRRTAEQLKSKFKLIKAETRKKIGSDRRSRAATGGGPMQPPNMSATDELVATIIGVSGEGENSTFDSDFLVEVLPTEQFEFVNLPQGQSSPLPAEKEDPQEAPPEPQEAPPPPVPESKHETTHKKGKKRKQELAAEKFLQLTEGSNMELINEKVRKEIENLESKIAYRAVKMRHLEVETKYKEMLMKKMMMEDNNSCLPPNFAELSS